MAPASTQSLHLATICITVTYLPKTNAWSRVCAFCDHAEKIWTMQTQTDNHIHCPLLLLNQTAAQYHSIQFLAKERFRNVVACQPAEAY
jgi:hypothetical protein